VTFAVKASGIAQSLPLSYLQSPGNEVVFLAWTVPCGVSLSQATALVLWWNARRLLWSPNSNGKTLLKRCHSQQYRAGSVLMSLALQSCTGLMTSDLRASSVQQFSNIYFKSLTSKISAQLALRESLKMLFIVYNQPNPICKYCIIHNEPFDLQIF
jgi:hypothetical protein